MMDCAGRAPTRGWATGRRGAAEDRRLTSPRPTRYPLKTVGFSGETAE
jgi:hypothetical protein